MTQPADYTLTTAQVAARLGFTTDTIARWADDGELPCLRTPGGFRRFRPEDVDAFATSMLPSAPEKAS